MARKTLSDALTKVEPKKKSKVKSPTKDETKPKQRKAVTVNIDKNLHHQLKILAAELDTTIGELLEEATTNILIKNGKM